jgi:RNA polymerase sigma-70 factor (ECF subfamily)
MTISYFEKEILPLKHAIARYANFMLKDMDDAQDITQEVLLKIWEKRDEMDQIVNKRAWAITITRNKCLDFIKAKKGERVSWEDNLDQIITDNPFDKLRVLDETNLIKNLMEQLPAKQKEVFYLRHFEGSTYQEIEENLAIDMNSVKVYLHRARTFIKKALEEKHNYGLKTG